MSGAERFEAGAPVAQLVVQVDTVHLFMFSAVTWNRHLIHYDGDQARAEGHSAVVAQRGLLGNYFARQVGEWLGSDGRMTALSWKVGRSAVPGDALTCTGVVDQRHGDTCQLLLEMVNQRGEQVATAAATAVVAPVMEPR